MALYRSSKAVCGRNQCTRAEIEGSVSRRGPLRGRSSDTSNGWVEWVECGPPSINVVWILASQRPGSLQCHGTAPHRPDVQTRLINGGPHSTHSTHPLDVSSTRSLRAPRLDTKSPDVPIQPTSYPECYDTNGSPSCQKIEQKIY